MQLNDEQINKLKLLENEMLREVVRICDELHLEYYLIGGTLLGAVRHKGFIPWDDDIDIGLLRADYEVFISRARDTLSHKMFLQNYTTDADMIFPFTKIRYNNTTFIETRSKNSKMHQGVWIDVFPLDYYEMSSVKRKINGFKKKLLNLRIAEEEYFEKSNNHSVPHIIAKKILTTIVHARYPKLSDAVKKIDRINSSSRACDIVINNCGAYLDKEAFPISWIGSGTEVDFEFHTYRTFQEYDKYLKQIYGDYLTPPPIEKRVSVHDIEVIDLNNSYALYTKQ